MKWQVDEAGAKLCKKMEAFQVTRGGIGDRLIDLWLVSSFPRRGPAGGTRGVGVGAESQTSPLPIMSCCLVRFELIIGLHFLN